MVLPKQETGEEKKDCNCGNGVTKIGEDSNGFAEIRERREKKIVIVTMVLPKQERIKKKGNSRWFC